MKSKAFFIGFVVILIILFIIGALFSRSINQRTSIADEAVEFNNEILKAQLEIFTAFAEVDTLIFENDLDLASDQLNSISTLLEANSNSVANLNFESVQDEDEQILKETTQEIIDIYRIALEKYPTLISRIRDENLDKNAAFDIVFFEVREDLKEKNDEFALEQTEFAKKYGFNLRELER